MPRKLIAHKRLNLNHVTFGLTEQENSVPARFNDNSLMTQRTEAKYTHISVLFKM